MYFFIEQMVKPFTHGVEHGGISIAGHAIASTPAVRGFFVFRKVLTIPGECSRYFPEHR